MPFPFLPLGAALAIAVLGGAFALFWWAVRALDRAASSARDAITGRVAVAPGLVAGLRTWGHDAGADADGEPAEKGLAGAAAHGDREPARPAGSSEIESDDDAAVAGRPIEDEDLPPSSAVPTARVHRG